MSQRICYKWGNADILWRGANWLWSECQLVEEIIGGFPGAGAAAVPPAWLREDESRLKEEDKKKRLRFIKLICKINGVKYEEEKMKKSFKIKVEDVKMVVKAVSGVDLDVKLEE